MIFIKKITPTAALFTAAALSLCSCGNSAAQMNAPGSETDVSVISDVSSAENNENTDMLDNALLSLGNNFRLKKKIEKMKSGEKTVMAYIGGSITEGAGAPSKDECFAAISCRETGKMFGAETECINAGLSGTPSVLGNLRLKKDVLDFSPDIVFVEFAVNDAQDDLHRESYESLVRTVLSQDNEPAVILIFNRTNTGYSCQEHMSEIGYHYDLPMISVNDALTAEIDSGSISWEDYSNDYAHPNGEWHKKIADMVCGLFTRTDSAETDPEYSLPAVTKFGKGFVSADIVTPVCNTDCPFISISETGAFEPSQDGAADFETSWHSDGSSSDSMKLTVKSNSFFIIYKRNNLEKMGAADISVNGVRLKTVNSFSRDGWGDPYSVKIIEFSDVKDMEVEITPVSDGKDFYILGFGFSENKEDTF